VSLRLPEINHVHLVGRVTRDPELRFTKKGTPVCSFSIAVNRSYRDHASGDWKEEVTFVPVLVWREAGEKCKERLLKGSPVQIEGRLKSREYEDKTGQKRRVMEVEARRVLFLAPAEPAPAGGEKAGNDGAPTTHSTGHSDETDEVPF
jgi:single-strand DNA-binding protein